MDDQGTDWPPMSRIALTYAVTRVDKEIDLMLREVIDPYYG